MKSASLNLFLLLQQLTSYLTLSLWLPCSLHLSARQKTNGASTCWLYPGLSRTYPGSSSFHLATSDLLHNKKPMELVAFPRDVPYKQLGPRTVHIFNLDLNASLLSWILKQSFTSLSDEATGFAAVPQKCFYSFKFTLPPSPSSPMLVSVFYFRILYLGHRALPSITLNSF